MKNYYKKIQDFQKKLKMYANNIFKTYGKELTLRLENIIYCKTKTTVLNHRQRSVTS